MEDPRRWIVGLIAVAAIIGMLLFVRGVPDAGRGTGAMSMTSEIASAR